MDQKVCNEKNIAIALIVAVVVRPLAHCQSIHLYLSNSDNNTSVDRENDDDDEERTNVCELFMCQCIFDRHI